MSNNDVLNFYQGFSGEETGPADTPWGLWYQEYEAGTNFHLACRYDHVPHDMDIGTFTPDGLLALAREIDVTTPTNMPKELAEVLHVWNIATKAVKWFLNVATDAQRLEYERKVKETVAAVKEKMKAISQPQGDSTHAHVPNDHA